MFILFLTSQPRHPTFRKSCRNTCERDCIQIFFWLIIQHIFYFFFNPSILKCTKTILLYPRVILILSSLYLQQKFSSVQLLVSQQFINYSKKKRQLNEWPYRSSRLNLLSNSTGYPNWPPIIAASSIVISYVLLLLPDFLQCETAWTY